MKRLMMRLVSEPVEPTAASASSPAKRPTTMTSAALNISCSMPESISGSAKRISGSSTGPFSMSISYAFLLLLIIRYLPITRRFSLRIANMKNTVWNTRVISHDSG